MIDSRPILDEEKLLCAYGEYVAAVKSVRARTGLGLAASKQMVDLWRTTAEARDLGVSCPSWLAPQYRSVIG